jgi:hypothetical protein
MDSAYTRSRNYSEKVLPNTVIEILEAVLGILGNFVVILVYTKCMKEKSMTRYFIPVLAVVDLVGCVSNGVFIYLADTMQYVIPSVYFCKMTPFFRIMTGGLSAHLILVIALQRYLLICRPLGQQLSRKHCRICIAFVFIFSLGYSAPMLKITDNKTRTISIANGTRNTSVSSCIAYRPASVPYLGTLFLVFLINIFVTIGLYIPVTKTIRQKLSPSRRNATPNSLDADPNIESNGSESTRMEKIIRMVETPSQETKKTIIDKPTASTKNSDHNKDKARKRFSVMFLVIIVVYIC